MVCILLILIAGLLFFFPSATQAENEVANSLPTVLQVGENYRRFEVLEPQPQVYYIRAVQRDTQAQEAKGWLPARMGRPTGAKVHVSRQLVLKTQEPILEDKLRQHSLEKFRQINSRLVIFNAANPVHALEMAQALCREPGVIACYPVMRRAYRRGGKFVPIPNDAYFPQVWHADNRDSQGKRQGIDLNLRAAWNVSRGKGVTVAVADNGLDLEHPDLSERAKQGPHFNFGNNRVDGAFINNDPHGTAVAGLIAAEGNNAIGVIGAAPEANLASLVIFEIDWLGQEGIVSDSALMDMFQFKIDEIAVQNHSWGPYQITQTGIEALSDIGIENAVRNGRRGKGVIIVRAGGNEREDLNNANDNGYANDPRSIAVAAVRIDGMPASYSTPGACLLVSAPSGDDLFPGVATTDLQGEFGEIVFGEDDAADYLLGNNGFTGTSASTPLVAGIAALLLSANPDLSYRDVQQIFIHASFQPENNDPDIEANGAGFRFSHNIGFGVPNAGFAVELAKIWKNRPAPTEIFKTKRLNRRIADEGLWLEIEGANIPGALRSIQIKPSLGVFAEEGTHRLPLVFVGEALEPIAVPLKGRAALIKRGIDFFAKKIRRAREAGAELAIIYNNLNNDEILLMGSTDFSAIPACSINQNDGEALLDLLGDQPDITAKISLDAATVEFDISDTLICEHVGLRLDTTHSRRGDLRITLVSPSGTRSVLQTLNIDESPGPRRWTYWSTKHFFEPSAGVWKLAIIDQTPEATGSIISASLILRGVPILDIDRDGLDDHWERLSFGSLHFNAQDDPDGDGFNNAREQTLQTPPNRPNQPLALDFSLWDSKTMRLSWPAQPGNRFDVLNRTAAGSPPQTIATLSGQFPEIEFLLPIDRSSNAFYTIQKRP